VTAIAPNAIANTMTSIGAFNTASSSGRSVCTKRRRGGVERRQLNLKGIEVGD
jgi:hypothetical protein